MASAFSFIFYLPLYLQAVLGETASQVGLWLLIGAFSALTGSLGGGLIMQTTGKYYRLTIVSLLGAIVVNLSTSLQIVALLSHSELTVGVLVGEFRASQACLSSDNYPLIVI